MIAAKLKRFGTFILFFVGYLYVPNSHAQSVDSLNTINNNTLGLSETTHSPHKATLLSLFLPGAGQVYNKKYWKVPLVYGLLGTSGYFFYDYQQKVQSQNDQFRALYAGGSQPTIFQIEQRDNDRVNRDMMGVAFVVIYVLQVVDATVDAHFFEFNIDEKLSFKYLENPGQLLSLHYRIP